MSIWLSRSQESFSRLVSVVCKPHTSNMKRNEIEKYTYRIMWSDEDEVFIGLCTEFPSLSWLASTSGKTLKGIQSVVKECVSDMSKTMKNYQ